MIFENKYVVFIKLWVEKTKELTGSLATESEKNSKLKSNLKRLNNKFKVTFLFIYHGNKVSSSTSISFFFFLIRVFFWKGFTWFLPIDCLQLIQQNLSDKNVFNSFFWIQKVLWVRCIQNTWTLFWWIYSLPNFVTLC